MTGIFSESNSVCIQILQKWKKLLWSAKIKDKNQSSWGKSMELFPERDHLEYDYILISSLGKWALS